MTFDPRWLNQLPLSSLKGGDINDVYSLTGSLGLNVGEWEAFGSRTIASNGVIGLDTTPLKSGNIFVAYEAGSSYYAAIRTASGASVVSPVVFGSGIVAGDVIKVATLSNGNVVVTFVDAASGNLAYIIYDERLNVVVPETLISGTTGFSQTKVTALADGNFVIAYTDSATKAAFRIFDIDGDIIKGETIITTSLFDRVEVIGLKNGNFMVGLASSGTLYFAIYNRQGVRIIAPTSFASSKTLLSKPLALLPNGQVVIGFITTGTGKVGYGLVDQDGNIVLAAADISNATSLSFGGVCTLPNNSVAMTYGTSTAIYFKVVGFDETAFTGTFTSANSIIPGVSNDGNFYCLFIDTNVKFLGVRGKSATFGKGLNVSGLLDTITFSFGGASEVMEGISNDTTLVGDSSVHLLTEHAAKTYIDQQTGNVPRNIIHENDSKVEVQDSTAEATQYITFVLNNNEVARMEDTGSATVLRLGPSGDTRIDLNTNTDVVSVKSGATEVLNLATATQVLGVGTDTAISLDQALDIISFKSANATVAQINASGLTLATGVTVNKFSNDATLGGYNGATGSDAIVASEKAVRGYIDGIHNAMRDPTGIEQRNDSTISFDSTSRVFSIVPTSASYNIFIRGQRYVIDSSTSVEITDVEGLHYIYFDANGVLQQSTTFSIDFIYTLPYVAVIYWDATNDKAIYIGDERHGIIMDGATHWNLHNSRGTVYLDGLGIADLITDGTGSLNTEAQLSVSAGSIVDEDITTSIPIKAAPANIPIFYRSGSGNDWRSSTANTFPLVTTGSGRMAWNEKAGGTTWQLTEATNDYYVYVHYFATNDYDNTRQIIGILGQTQYSDLTTAQEQANQINEMVLQGMPFVEFVAIGSVLYQTSDSFTNSVKTAARPAQGGYYADWRYAKISSVPGQVTDHGSLSGLGDDDHLQYARLSGTRPFTGLITFNGGLDVNTGNFTLASGVAVNDISNDTTLVDDSSASIPTEHAVKAYVDSQIGGLNPNKIWQDDSKVEVIDDGTAPGYIQIVADNVQVAYFDVLASTQRVGKAATNLSITDTTVKANVNSNTYLDIDPVGSEWIRIGRAGGGLGSRIDMSTASGGGLDIYVDNVSNQVQILGLQASEQFIGNSGNVQLGMNQTNNTIYITTTSYRIFDFDTDVLKVGKSNGTRVEINESTDVITLNPNDVVQATIDSAGLTLANGVGINEFSIDGTLAGDSTSVVPTEYAVKDYVDTAIAGLAPNRIWQLNSEVVVTDTGTDGNISIKADGLEVGSFTDNRVIIGDVDSVHFKADLDDTELFFNTASGQRGSVTSNRVWFGINGTDAGIDIRTGDQTVDIYAGDSPDLVKVALDSTSISMFINELDTVFYGTYDSFGVGNPNGAPGTAWILGTTEGIKVIDVDSTDQIALFDSTGLQLATGAKINEFSTDDTLGDATPSDNTVPTQAAVKAYVDSQIGGQANRIWEGDSEVRVTDAGTGSIVTKADNTDVQSLTLNTQRVGQAASSRVELVVSPAPTVDLYAGTTNVFNGSLTSVTVGMSADTRMNINNVADIISFATGNINVAQLSLTTLRIGQAADSRLVLDTENDYADLYAGTTQIIDGATTSQTFGVSGDSNLFLDQANNYADLYAGANRIVRGELNLQVFGVASDSRLETDQTNDTIDLYAGNVKVVNSTTNVLTLGVSGDTYFAINQADDQINAYTGNTLQMQVENSGVSVEGDLTVRGNLSIDGTAFIVFNEEVKTEDNIITVNYGDPGPGVTRGLAGLEIDRGSEPIYQFIFQESTDTFRVGETGQTQAVATRENDPDGYKVAWWSDDDRMFKTLGDEYIKIDQTSNNIIFVTGLAQRALIDSNGLTLQNGTSVNEFSTDVTLDGDSDDAVPTEKAVKTYVDSQIGGQSNIIFMDDSNVTVTDDGTTAGYIIVTADGAPVATFMNNYVQIMNPLTAGALFDVEVSTPGVFAAQVGASGWGMYAYDDTTGPSTGVNLGYINGTAPLLQITGDNGIAGANALTLTLLNSASTEVVPLSITSVEQRLGIDSDTRLLVNQSLDSVLVYIASDATPVMNLQSNMQQLGKSGDTMVSVNQSANLVAFVANNVNVVSVTDTTARIGIAGDSRLFLDSGNDIADLYAGAVQIIDGATTSQVFGVAGDSRLTLDQSTDIAAIYAGAKQLILLEPTIATFGNGDEAKLTVTATQATLYAGTTAVATAVATSQTFGAGSDSRLFLDQANDLADLYAGTTQIIDGAMTSQTFGVSGDSRLALDQTADTAQLYAGATLALDCGVNVITLGTAADTNIALDQNANTIVFESNNTTQATISTTGLALNAGASVNEFSIDGTLVGNSDTAVPTEQAVKTYVDTEINELRQELDLINVRNVYTDTTASTGDVVLADTTAGDITIQLLESTDGKIIIKKKSTDGNKVYITTTPGLIDGQSQIIIDTGYQAYTFVCDGTNFFII